MHYRYLTLEQRESLERLIRAQLPRELERLHTPDYGICESCGADIPYARLLRAPAERRCAGCTTKN